MRFSEIATNYFTNRSDFRIAIALKTFNTLESAQRICDILVAKYQLTDPVLKLTSPQSEIYTIFATCPDASTFRSINSEQSIQSVRNAN